MDTESLLCPSRDYTQSLVSSTGYCTFYGIGVFYFSEVGLMLWASHVAIVLWQISFPLQAKYAQTSKHYYLLHAAIVTLATVLPAGYIAISVRTGDHRPFYNPSPCIPASTEAVLYYSVVHNLIGAIGVSLLVLLMWVLVKRRWKCALNTSRNNNEHIHHGNTFFPTTALVKVLLIFFCNTTLVLIGLYADASALRLQSEYTKELTEYFICESTGTSPNTVCRRSFESLNSPIASTVSLFLNGTLFPLFTLLYVVNLEKLCRSVNQCRHGRNVLHGTSALQMSVSIKKNPQEQTTV